MSKKPLIIGGTLLALGAAGLFAYLLQGHSVDVLSPQGIIAEKQRDLLVFASVLSLIVIIPVFILTFFIVWKYRAGNTKATYTPDWDHSNKLETLWWGIPCAIILVLAVITWQSSHALDPFKPISSDYKPITIQVIALQWKWLFIYPEQNIATVNYVRFPESTPVSFQITADAPMNSFWIPQLGGQVYAMSGMSTQLHLMANNPGVYNGSSANLSGEGFADMRFKAESTTQDDFYAWVQSAKQSRRTLTSGSYRLLASPSTEQSTTTYASAEPNLYTNVIMKYMAPGGSSTDDGHGSHGVSSQPNDITKGTE